MLRKTAFISALSALTLSVGLISTSAGAAVNPGKPNLAEPIAASAHSPLPTRHAGLLLKWKGGTDWMGSYNVTENGKPAIADCVTPLLDLYSPDKSVTGVYGTLRQSAEISYIMGRWGNSPSSSVAAEARDAMLTVLGRIREYPGLAVPGGKKGAFQTAVNNDIAAAAYSGGPYTSGVSFALKPTTPGQPGLAVFSILSREGHAIPGIAAHFTAAGASIGASGRSGVRERFVRTATSAVSISGSALVSSDKVVIGTSGHRASQTLVSSISSAVSASSSYQSHAARVRATVRCNCNGTGNITGKVSQAAGADEGRYTLRVNGKAAGSITIPSGKHGVTADIKVNNVPDGSVVTFTASYLVNGKWTAPTALGGTFTVHCPIVPLPTAATKCNCATGAGSTTASVTLAVTNSSKYDDELVYTTGGKTYLIQVPASSTKVILLPRVTGSVLYYATVQQGGVTIARTPKYLAGLAS